jgi:hypothetical protein
MRRAHVSGDIQEETLVARPCSAAVFLGAALINCGSTTRLTAAPASSQPGAPPTTAELLQEIRLMRRQMEEQQLRHDAEIATLRSKIEELNRKEATATGGAQTAASGPSGEDELEAAISQATGGPAPSPAQRGGQSPLSLQGAVQSFNPDISINGDFLGTFSTNRDDDFDDDIRIRELEISFSGAVDPYTTATAIVTVGQEENDNEFTTDLEEAYLTYVGLPFDLQTRFGQFRSDFGKANPMHLHALPWVDYPLVIQRYFGDEGLSGAGAELSWLIPNPMKQYLLLTYEVFSNDNSSMFAGQQANDLTNLLHLKSFYDLSPTSTLELGGSFAVAPNDSGHGAPRSMIEGVDLTYRWKPRDAGLYRAFLFQNEVLFAQADLLEGQESTWGMYSAAEYQFARQFKLGVRYDHTQLPFSSSLHENGYSAYLTFLQSEFVFWRLGYLFTNRNFEQDGDDDEQQLFLQLNWTLGTHPAHKY